MNESDIDLCYISATDALAKFQSKELSPVELTKVLVKRCEQVNPQINAITEAYFDEAILKAKTSEKKYMTAKSSRVKPLEGVPIAIKDFHSVKGRLTTYGSKAYENHIADNTAPTVERLLKAGANLLFRTTTPEFAYSGLTRSPLWGVTNNPWNVQNTPGGSSGGAGASIAAGMTTLADGTDGGGSCRIPAAFSGCVGYKPPYGRNPGDREHPLESLLVYGPITRTVADAALMQNVTMGRHVADMTSLPRTDELTKIPQSVKGMKIALSVNLGFYEVSADVEKNTRSMATSLRRMGATVEEVDVGWNWGVLDTWYTRWEGAFGGLVGDLLPRWKYEMSPFCASIAERGLSHSASRFYKTNAGRAAQWETLGPILEKYDALICPTLAISSLPNTHNEGATDFTINGKSVNNYLGWSLTFPFNNLNWCPVMSIPSGFGDDNMPTGLQICGRTFDDASVFQIAGALEKSRPWSKVRPDL
jgi:Asp-tRNA(Asn)/Glu-tRNA(Gln) amidotransferase A subunit family amidase